MGRKAVIFKYDFANSSSFTPYIGGGVGIAHASFDASGTTILGAFNSDDSDNTFAYQLGAGVAYDIAPQLALTADYRWLDTAHAGFDATLGGTPVSFDAGDYRAHEVKLGVRYSF